MEKKIKEMADKLAKSFEEQENLKEFKQLVEEIGKENISQIVKSLPEESQVLFKATLEKSMSMDKEAQEKHGAKVKQVVSEDAREDEDEEAKKRREADKGEKMVKKPGADKISHQGDNTELPGQVIKSKDCEDEVKEHEAKMHKAKDSKAINEEGALKDIDNSKNEKVIADPKKEVKESLKEAEGRVEKANLSQDENEIVNGDVEKGAFKEAAIEDLNKGELLHKMIEKMRQRGMDHDKVMDALGKKGYDVEMAKGKWEEMQKMDDEAAKKDEKSVKKSEEPVQKSVNWASANERLEVNVKRGHNTHYDVDSYIVQKALDKAAGPKEEVLEKAEKEFNSNDVNDLIEKGYDRSVDDVNQAIGHVRKPEGGKYNTSSFDDAALAKSFGMTVEQMNEVLGYPKSKAQ